jgi:hypothetical protein
LLAVLCDKNLKKLHLYLLSMVSRFECCHSLPATTPSELIVGVHFTIITSSALELICWGNTVKSPNFVTAHYFVTAAENFCEALKGF